MLPYGLRPFFCPAPEPLITVTLLIYQEYVHLKTLVGTLPDQIKFSASRVARWKRKRVGLGGNLFSISTVTASRPTMLVGGDRMNVPGFGEF